MTIYDHAENVANEYLGERKHLDPPEVRYEWDHVFLHEAVMEMDRRVIALEKEMNTFSAWKNRN